MKRTFTNVMLQNLTTAENPRLVELLNLSTMVDSIAQNGLQTPLLVWQRVKGEYEIIQGHCRFTALTALSKERPERFAELFGKGIPCLEVKEVTSEEVVVLKLDHSDQRELKSPHEVQRSANMLFAIGQTEAEVANTLANLFDRVAPMNPKARLELKALQDKVASATSDAERTLAQQAVFKFQGDYRRGYCQGLHNTYRCPEKVMSALFKAATGHNPEGVTEYLPKLTSAQVTALWKAHKEDLAILENGIPRFNKFIVGPHFTEKWNSIVKAEQEAVASGETKEPRAKAMSAKEMQETIKNGEYKSQLACKLTFHHAGDAKSAELPELDHASYLLDLIKQHDKPQYEAVIKAGTEILARLVAASAKVETK